MEAKISNNHNFCIKIKIIKTANSVKRNAILNAAFIISHAGRGINVPSQSASKYTLAITIDAMENPTIGMTKHIDVTDNHE